MSWFPFPHDLAPGSVVLVRDLPRNDKSVHIIFILNNPHLPTPPRLQTTVRHQSFQHPLHHPAFWVIGWQHPPLVLPHHLLKLLLGHLFFILRWNAIET